MADTQEAPHPATLPIPPDPNSLGEAHDAILSLLDSAVETEESPRREESDEPAEEDQEESEEPSETPEDESDESEEDDEEDGDGLEESEEEDESGDDDIALYTVRVNGEEIEVTEDELVKGYSRQADYTKKTQELSEQRRNIEQLESQYNSQLGQMQQERQQYKDALNQLIQQSSNIDWNRLKEEDPIEFITKRDEYREAQERVRSGQHQYTLEQQKQAGEMQALQQQVLQQEHAQMVEKIPEWGDPTQQKVLATGLR